MSGSGRVGDVKDLEPRQLSYGEEAFAPDRGRDDGARRLIETPDGGAGGVGDIHHMDPGEVVDDISRLPGDRHAPGFVIHRVFPDGERDRRGGVAWFPDVV